ncbi:MAG: FecR domain-containing protein [Leptonema sp. (in: Bacteria)]|nr:FecR domain-containing protein [Leptonema sp. (in: bacteria)]
MRTKQGKSELSQFQFVPTVMLVALTLIFAITACKDKSATDEAKTLSMVVTFTSGNVKVVRDGKGVPASIGMIVYQNDLIQTENGTVDLQTRTGSAVRVREMTSLTVAKIAGQDGGETRINIEQGGMLANVKKASADESFNVATPTAIAGVRGTSFSVDIDPIAQTSSVKVLEGKVAMAPRIIALETATQEEIQNSPALKKMAEVQSKEVVIEEKTEGRLNPTLEKHVLAANELATSQENTNTARKEIEKMATTIEATAGNTVMTQEAQITQQDLIEQQTLIVVAPELLNKISSEESNETARKEIIEVRAKNESEVLKKVEEIASKEQLNTEQAVQQRYNRLEVITLSDGTKIVGAVIAQTGDVLVIHSPQGVRRVNKADIESQEFR